MELPILYLIIPCYNEQAVLPITAPQFLKKLTDLTVAGKIAPAHLEDKLNIHASFRSCIARRFLLQWI